MAKRNTAKNIENKIVKNTNQPNSESPNQNKNIEMDIKTLDGALAILKESNITKRVNALMYLNDRAISNLEEEKNEIIDNCNKVFSTFVDVLNEIFDCSPDEVPIRFGKYFMTVVSKICMDQAFIVNVNENIIMMFIEQLLTKFMYEQLEQLGSNSEGEYLAKAFNTSILKIIEYYDSTKSFVILLSLYKKYKETISLYYIQVDKLPDLILKCILKLTKSIPSVIETLNISRIFLALHEYLLKEYDINTK